MYLEEAARHAEASGRGAWLLAKRAHLDPLVADVLVDFRDPETGLVAAESSIWETHWDNGARQRWAFTSGRAVRGLSDWADALDRHAGPNDPAAARYRASAAALREGMEVHLIDPATGAIGASVEQLRAPGGMFADAQTALILRDDLFAPASATGLATLELIRDRLFLSATTRRGYRRNDDGGEYDRREWVVIDLGLARVFRQAGSIAEADALLAWVTDQAAFNFGLVPELLHEDDARYFGEVPMAGFGAGAYLSALVERSGTEAPRFEGDDAGPPDGGAGDAGAGRDAADPTDGRVDDGGFPDGQVGSAADAGHLADAAGTAADAGRIAARATECSCGSVPSAGGAGRGPGAGLAVMSMWAFGAAARRVLRRRNVQSRAAGFSRCSRLV